MRSRYGSSSQQYAAQAARAVQAAGGVRVASTEATVADAVVDGIASSPDLIDKFNALEDRLAALEEPPP